jgi:hypothetical protein
VRNFTFAKVEVLRFIALPEDERNRLTLLAGLRSRSGRFGGAPDPTEPRAFAAPEFTPLCRFQLLLLGYDHVEGAPHTRYAGYYPRRDHDLQKN